MQDNKKTPSAVNAWLYLLIVPFLLLGMSPFSVLAEEYPAKPISLVVGFGIGGSSDRMARAMSASLRDAIGQPVQVVNKKGAAALIGMHYTFKQPADGYTIYAGALSPYMAVHIRSGRAEFTLDDWEILNIQWPDYTLYAASKKSGYTSLVALLQAMKERPGKVRGAVMQNSVGLLTIKMMLAQAGIPLDTVNLVTYASGGKARAAVAGGVVDFIAIAAEGCRGIKEFVVPLAVGTTTAAESEDLWDAPAINAALAGTGVSVPVLNDAVRGYAVPVQFKQEFPKRYQKLVNALKRATRNKEAQHQFKQAGIGGQWIGPAKATRQVRKAAQVFGTYKDLLERK